MFEVVASITVKPRISETKCLDEINTTAIAQSPKQSRCKQNTEPQNTCVHSTYAQKKLEKRTIRTQNNRREKTT